MNAFVVVGNVHRFDIVKHFNCSNMVVWKQVSKGKIGDEVYIYIGRPLSRLVYKCRIVEINVNADNVEYVSTYEGKRKPSYMKLELMEELPAGGLDLVQLLDHGLKTVQCSTMIDEKLKSYIDEVIKKWNLKR